MTPAEAYIKAVRERLVALVHRCEALPRVDVSTGSIKHTAQDSVKLTQMLDVAIAALEFYAKHHHHLKTTAPNFGRQALAEIDRLAEGSGE